MIDIVNRIAPEKILKVASDYKPWFTETLKDPGGKRRTEFHIN